MASLIRPFGRHICTIAESSELWIWSAQTPRASLSQEFMFTRSRSQTPT